MYEERLYYYYWTSGWQLNTNWERMGTCVPIYVYTSVWIPSLYSPFSLPLLQLFPMGFRIGCPGLYMFLLGVWCIWRGPGGQRACLSSPIMITFMWDMDPWNGERVEVFFVKKTKRMKIYSCFAGELLGLRSAPIMKPYYVWHVQELSVRDKSLWNERIVPLLHFFIFIRLLSNGHLIFLSNKSLSFTSPSSFLCPSSSPSFSILHSIHVFLPQIGIILTYFLS